MAREKDYYRILGVDVDASDRDIEQAYRRAARVYYRDHTHRPDEEDQFKEQTEAYAVLIDPQMRAEHDERMGLAPRRRWPHGFYLGLDLGIARVSFGVGQTEEALVEPASTRRGAPPSDDAALR